MIFKQEINCFSYLFTVNSVFWVASYGLSSAQDWNSRFSLFVSITQTNISNTLDKILYSQSKITPPNSLNPKLTDWFTVSANLDSAYHNTNFDSSEHHTVLSQGDSRFEFWMPSGRDEFSWGPYVRFAGLTSDRSPTWENACLAQPDYGVSIYPFGSADLRKESEKTVKVLGSLRLFGEYNRQEYWGRENIWRPNEQIRAGTDYWKAPHVNNTFMPWWTEAWSGLFWQSSNEFDEDHDPIMTLL